MKRLLTSVLVFCFCRIMFPVVIAILTILPHSFFKPFSKMFAGLAANWMGTLSTKSKSRTFENLEQTNFSVTEPKSQFFVEMLFSRFIQYLETMYELARPGSCVIENKQEFKEFMHVNSHPGKGALAVTAHLGNWELMGKIMAEVVADRTCLMLAKKNKYAEVSRLVERMRVDMGMGVLFVDEKSGIKRIMKNLHADTLVGLVADQKSASRAGPKATFFGVETDFVSGPQRLSKKFKIPLVFCYAIRTGPLKYRVEFSKLEPADFENLETYTQAMAQQFEVAIKSHPKQWVWDYKKWVF